MTEIAGWNSLDLDRLARSEHVYVPGHFLTGEQVTDHPELVTASLTGHLTPAPDTIHFGTTATYHVPRTRPFRPSPPAPMPEAGVDRAADVNVIAHAGYRR